jgi:hypothetical protein
MVTAPSDGCLDSDASPSTSWSADPKNRRERVRSGAQPNRTLGRVTTAQPFSPKTFIRYSMHASDAATAVSEVRIARCAVRIVRRRLMTSVGSYALAGRDAR